MAELRLGRRRRTVANRVLLSYLLVLLGFSLVAGWSVVALRDAAREAALMRSGYLPLSLDLRDLVAIQDTWNTQLNHVTSARNPADKRMWFDTALRIGRPKKYGEVRAQISRAFATTRDPALEETARQLMRETSQIEQASDSDREQLAQLFTALDEGQLARADRLRDELVKRGSHSKKRLSLLEQRVQGNIDALINAARGRERLAVRLLIALSVFSALIGATMAWYAQRVLRPLAAVTARAEAVAQGDLTPRPVVATPDEIGELAATFESMVTAIASASEQLLTAERLATIGKMAAHVTHEIRNPLSSMALNVELLEEELADQDKDEARALLRAIKAEVERLTAISGQYLSVARQGPVALEDEDLGEVATAAADFLRADLKRRGVELRFEMEPDLPRILADEGQIRQALFNLIRNAGEAMPNGGTVTVRASSALGGGVDLSVDDDGLGMDAQTRARLFEPFFTTKHHGTGLGLAITRQIVERHGGTITCMAREPRGTRFLIHLPAVTPAILASRDSALPNEPVSRRSQVL
jgi:signal transduction histidine kinase